MPEEPSARAYTSMKSATAARKTLSEPCVKCASTRAASKMGLSQLLTTKNSLSASWAAHSQLCAYVFGRLKIDRARGVGTLLQGTILQSGVSVCGMGFVPAVLLRASKNEGAAYHGILPELNSAIIKGSRLSDIASDEAVSVAAVHPSEHGGRPQAVRAAVRCRVRCFHLQV